MSDVDEDVELLREAGAYESDSAVIEDAIRSLLRSNPELASEYAVEKYRTGRVTRNRAAEIGGLSSEEFKELLHDRGIPREAGFLSAEDRDQELGELSMAVVDGVLEGVEQLFTGGRFLPKSRESAVW